ncbi:unnamed protein product, partial [Allacma fusca]
FVAWHLPPWCSLPTTTKKKLLRVGIVCCFCCFVSSVTSAPISKSPEEKLRRRLLVRGRLHVNQSSWENYFHCIDTWLDNNRRILMP